MKIPFICKEIARKTKIDKKIYLPLRRKYVKRMIQKDPVKYIEKRYKKIMGRKLNLDCPVTYTEKLQWRKLYDNNPLYTLCADKVAVRAFVDTVRKQYNAQMDILFMPCWYGIFNSPDEMDFQELPDKFVLKTNHASGQVIIINDKQEINIRETKKQLKKWIKINFYYKDAEKHYKDIEPKIICEELLDSNIIDYRFFCFDGEPYLIKVTQHSGAEGEYDEATFYADWTKTDIVWNRYYGKLEVDKPENLDDMLEIARRLSGKFNFVRVDLYNYKGKIYFSELTFTPNSGLERNLSYEWDKRLGDKFKIGQEAQ